MAGRLLTTALLVAMGCNGAASSTDKSDTGVGVDPPPTTSPPPTASDFCAVQAVFQAECVVCHNPTLFQGDLDLETDPYGATVGVVSAAFGAVLVEPGSPDGSLLYRKMAGTQDALEGDPMPPTASVTAAQLDTVLAWIDDGAAAGCDTPITTTTGAYHPPGWDAADVHGLATNLQTEQDCRSCHGNDLSGGTSTVACDDCHDAGWETDCTFCHGGGANNTGAPPEDIDNQSNPNMISFPGHTAHVTETNHGAYDCTECHDKPTEALDPGHLFDDPTAGVAELNFGPGAISDNGTYNAGSCGNLWCHGDGAGDNGTANVTDGPRSCESCHRTSGLNGHHSDHLDEGIDCEECHPDVDRNGVSVPEQHVNGQVEVDPEGSVVFNGNTCSGNCHFEQHNNRSW